MSPNAELRALARIQAELDTGRSWDALLPETRSFYVTRLTTTLPLALASAPNSSPLAALHQWQCEVKAGVRGQNIDQPTTMLLDPLFLAANWELLGLQAQAQDETSIAQQCFGRAASIIRGAMHPRSAA